MKTDTIVLYVFSKYDNIKRLKEFVEHYYKYDSGYKHKLIICYKLIKDSEIKNYRLITSKLKHDEFIDKYEINDFEFMSMYRAIKKYRNYKILFLNSHAYPAKKNWLRLINSKYSKNSFIGFSGSNESMFSSLKFKKKYRLIRNLYHYYYFKYNFKKFPNPHIRLPSFFLLQNDFIKFINDKKYKNKHHAWITESGKRSMTNFFKIRGYKIFILNADGNKFQLNNMKNSLTFCYDKQNKLIISDRHTRNYDNSSNLNKSLLSKRVWG